MRRKFVLGATLALSVALVGCGSSSGSSGGAKDSGGGVTTGTEAKGTPVLVEVGDMMGVDGPMTMTATPASVAAGKVTFTLKNTGTIEHEVVVLKTDTPFDQLVVTKGKVSEKDSVGEVPELAAGKTASVTLDLKPGSYALVCNIKDHYGMGMRAAFTVT
ncbi:MAG: hypothetical protein JJE46_03420 [Acidimicrobiia bacterium]|nr:hypothetical protein [Acidimicrobiia bacterium]